MKKNNNFFTNRIINKVFLILVCAFIFISNFEVTKVLALTHTEEKYHKYGEYYESEYSYDVQVNTIQEIEESSSIENHIRFELNDELNNVTEDNQIDDSSYNYEYSIDQYTVVFESSEDSDYKKIEISNDPINYIDKNGELQQIETLIEESHLDEFEYENITNTIESYYPNELENGLMFKVNETLITYKPLLIQNNIPETYDNQIIYPLNDDINLHYIVKNSYIKENIILNAPIDNNVFENEISIENGSYNLLNNRLYIYDENDKPLLYIEAPLAYDSNSNQTSIIISIENDILTYSVDSEWLNDENRVYPITIDPSFVYILDNDGSDISVLESKPDETIGLGDEDIDKLLYFGNDIDYQDSYSFYTYASYKKAPKNIIVDSFIITYDIDSTDFDNIINYSVIEEDIFFSNLTYNDVALIKEKVDDIHAIQFEATDESISFDFTDYVKILLEENNQDVYIFMYLEDDTHYLRLDSTSAKVEFKFHYQTDEDDGFDNLEYYLRPFVKSIPNQGITEFISLGVDGSDSLNRNISVSLYQNESLIETKTASVDDYLYNYPNYPLVEDCPDKFNKLESNWQLSSLFENLDVDKLYTIKINDGYFEKEETFRLYTVKDFVLIQNLASFYGVDIETLIEDNNLSNSLIYEGNILFIRKPSLNKNKDYYPEDLNDINSAINASLRGNSSDENSNIIMGNFVLENIDFTLLEADLQFDLIRTYNSNSHNQLTSMGYGFDFSYNSYVLKGKTGAILLLPSGKKLFFSKDGNSYVNNLSNNYELTYKDDHFELLFKDDNTKYVFDSSGNLSKIIYHTGKTINLSYTNRLLSKVDLGSNAYLSFTYNKKSLLTKVSASDGTSISYEYDDNANLISFTDQLSNKSTYEYDENHLMISYEDFNGKTIYQNKYNDDFKIVKQTDSLGNSRSLEYLENKVIFTDSKDNQTIYYYDENYYTTKVEYPDDSCELYQYELGILKSYTNKFGLGYSYTYDTNNNLIKEERSDGFVTNNLYDESSNLLKSSNSYNQVVTYTYDEKNNPLTKTDSLGNTYTYTYNSNSKLTSETDPNGNKTTYEYDENNNLTKINYPDGTYHKMAYNASGFLISITNEKGHTETHTLDDKNQLLIVTYPDGSKEKYDYDNNGNIIKYENRNGGVSIYEYDSNNLIIKSIDPKGYITTYEYDSNSNLIKTEFPDDSYIINEYDCLDRLIKRDTNGYIEECVYNQYGIATYIEPLHIAEYEYDYLGNIYKETVDNLETINVYDSLSRLVESTNSKGITNTYEYDLNNQLIKETSPLNSVSFEYDKNGNLTKETIISNNSTKTNRYEYDSRNNLTKRIDSLNNQIKYEYDGLLLVKQIDQLGSSVSYTYDSNSRITSVIDQNNKTSYIKYDYEGNILEEKDKNGNTTRYTYDLNDNLVSKTNPDGGIYTYVYDSMNRLIKETSPLSKVITYNYDGYGNILETRINDRLVSSYTYDDNTKLLLSETTNRLTSTFTYDNHGNLKTLTNPYGQIFKYDYDKYDRLVKEYTDEGILSSFVYNNYDLLLSETDKYGKTISYTYNDDLNLIYKKDHNIQYYYEYDLLDNVVKEEDYLGNIKTYEYDNDYRLIKTETNNRVNQYEYDNASNLIGFIDSLGQKTSYTYDSNGNLIKKVNNDNHVYEYEYDSHNRLVLSKTDNKLESKTIYDLDNRIFEIYDGENNKTTYIYDLFDNNIAIINPKGYKITFEYDEYFNLVKQIDPKGNTTYNTYNDLNQLVETKDAKGNSSYYEYDLYNNISSYTNPLGGINTYVYNYKNQLLETISSTGLKKNYSYSINNDILDVYYDDVLNNHYIYDDYFRLIEESDALEYKKNYTYDSYNNVIYFSSEHDFSRTYEYDNLDRLISEKDSTDLLTTYKYDSNNNITTKQISDSIYLYKYDSRNNLIEYTNPNNNVTKYEYDNANRLIKQIDSLDNYKTYTYDENNNLIEETDYNLNITRHVYDENDNLIQDIDSLGNTKTYTYDENNNLKSCQNELGYISTYEYDEANNLVSIKNNILQDNSHLISYEYDNSSRLIKAKSYEGIEEIYTYDNRDNVLTYQQGSVTTFYTYDLNNNLIRKDYIRYEYDRLNRLFRVTDDTGVSIYTYNSESDLLSLKQVGELISYTYTDKHEVESINYGNNREIEYTYDLVGNIKSVKDNDSHTVYTYDELNREVNSQTVINNKEDLINNSFGINRIYADNEEIISTSKSYDNNSNIISIKSNLNNSVLLKENYEYNSLNKLIHKYSNKDGNISKAYYEYNEAGQLIESDNNGNKKTYVRLPDGRTLNIEGNNSTLFEYNDDGQLIKTSNNESITTYQYDDRGNRISETSNHKTINYKYDKYNNLLKITNPDGYFFEYEYDGLNNRISLRVPYKVYTHPKTSIDSDSINKNNLTKDYNEHNNYLIEETRYKKLYYLNDYTTNTDTYIGIKVNDDYRYTTIGNNTILTNDNFVISDYLNSTVLSISKDNTNTYKTYGYSDYGISNISYNPLDDRSISISYTDEDLSLNSLVYLHSRYYDPKTQSFVSKDTYRGSIYDSTSFNGYTYCDNDPINYIDPTGHILQRPTMLSDGGGYSKPTTSNTSPTTSGNSSSYTRPASSSGYTSSNTSSSTYTPPSTSASSSPSSSSSNKTSNTSNSMARPKTTYTYTPPPRKVSIRTTSSSATEGYNLSIWQKALNGINNMSKSYSDMKGVLSYEISKTNTYKAISNSGIFKTATNFINKTKNLVSDTINRVDNYMDKHPTLKTVVGVVGIAAGIGLAAITGGAAIAALTATATVTKVAATALKTGSFTDAIYEAGKTSLITGAIGAIGSTAKIASSVIKVSSGIKKTLALGNVITSGALAIKCTTVAVKQFVTNAVIIEDPNISFKDKVISVLETSSDIATAGSSLLAFGNSINYFNNLKKDTNNLYRKMSIEEYNRTIETKKLQGQKNGSDSSKWLSQSYDKVNEFNNKAVNPNTEQVIVEFEMNSDYIDYLKKTAIPQSNSKGQTNVKYNVEGLENSSHLRNYGITTEELDFFNQNIENVRRID